MNRAVAIVFVGLAGGCDRASATTHEPVRAPVASAAPVADPVVAPPRSAAPTTPPAAWPAGFPTVTGGVPREAPPMGPVRVGLIGYPTGTIDAIDHAYREALTAAGWTTTDAEAEGEARRFVAEHQAESVSVSIYTDGGETIVQTMQLGSIAASR